MFSWLEVKGTPSPKTLVYMVIYICIHITCVYIIYKGPLSSRLRQSDSWGRLPSRSVAPAALWAGGLGGCERGDGQFLENTGMN